MRSVQVVVGGELAEDGLEVAARQAGCGIAARPVRSGRLGTGHNGLFFRFIAAAYERPSLGLASYWPFDQWGRFLPDETTAVSMIDRILHHAVVVVTEGEPFRMKEAKTRGGGPPKRKG